MLKTKLAAAVLGLTTTGAGGIVGFTNIPEDIKEIPPAVIDAALVVSANATHEDGSRCPLKASTLLGISKVESHHTLYYTDDGPDLNGIINETVYGPALNGRPGMMAIRDTDNGIFDGDTIWDRAVGITQAIPESWLAYTHASKSDYRTATDYQDGDGDGIWDINNVYDGMQYTANHLCHRKMTKRGAGIRGNDAATNVGERITFENDRSEKDAIGNYNFSQKYVRDVYGWALRYRFVDDHAPGAFSFERVQQTGGGGHLPWQMAAESGYQFGIELINFPLSVLASGPEFIGEYGQSIQGKFLNWVNARELEALQSGQGGGQTVVRDVSWPDGQEIAKGIPEKRCQSGYRALNDDQYCVPSGSAHPTMTRDVSRAISAWLQDRGAPGTGIGQCRVYNSPTGAYKSDHRMCMGLDIGLNSAAGSKGRLMDELAQVLCQHTKKGIYCGKDSPGYSCSSAIRYLAWKTDRDHMDHIHVSICNNATPQAIQSLIMDLGGVLVPETETRVQGGGRPPRHYDRNAEFFNLSQMAGNKFLVGDSIAVGVVQAADRNKEVGVFTGSRVKGAEPLSWCADQLPSSGDVILICGTNDLGVSEETLRARISNLMSEANGSVHWVESPSNPPFNRALRSITPQYPNLHVIKWPENIEMQTDGIHPTWNGSSTLLSILKKV